MSVGEEDGGGVAGQGLLHDFARVDGVGYRSRARGAPARDLNDVRTIERLKSKNWEARIELSAESLGSGHGGAI